MGAWRRTGRRTRRRSRAALDGVAPRLRRVREQRGFTLTEMSERTGISKSTLSRLENGQRKPSLELLLPLAQAYRVPLDDLVGAPEVGDPRIRLKPRRVNGRTVLPLTHPGGVQAWKIVIPASQSKPNPRTHDGFEWLYVLAGRMRLILGDQDLVLGVGEAAEFDTQVPHWFGSTGDGPAEVLSIFGRPGERMHVRAGWTGVGRAGRGARDQAVPAAARAGRAAAAADRAPPGPVADGGRVILVSAPAGFGKTTLLATWLGVRWPGGVGVPRRVRPDASSFWTYVVTALDRAVPGVGASTLPLLQAGRSPPRTCWPGCSTSSACCPARSPWSWTTTTSPTARGSAPG